MVVAHASSHDHDKRLTSAAVAQAQARTGGRPFAWCGDGWRDYGLVLTEAYRRTVREGRVGRPRKRVPDELALTQRIKHTDSRGRLLSIETKATIGALVTPPGTTRVERLNGVLRDRLNCLTRKTHAFAKRDQTWWALVTLCLFEHDWLKEHVALRQEAAGLPNGRRYLRRSPAMADGLTDHIWSWEEFLSLRPDQCKRE
jgi:hypothetical protein